MPNYLTHKLEFSQSALSVSNAAAVWTDVSAYLIEADWSSGKQRELDDFQTGAATFLLRNKNRRFEPEYAASPYYPNIVPMRRFRLTLTADGVAYPQGVFYTQSWQVVYPSQGSTESQVLVSCQDGGAVLTQQRQNYLDPPTAESYADVVMDDNPFAYYTLGDVDGRKMSAEAGPEGVYRSGASLGQPSPVLGDAGYGVVFSPLTNTAHGRAKLDDQNVFQDANAFTIEAVIVNNTGVSIGSQIAAGPQNATSATLELQADQVFAVVGTSTLVSTASSNTPTGRHHLVGTFDGSTLSFYRDGALIASTPVSDQLAAANTGEFLYAGSYGGVGTDNLIIGHVAFYNYPLTAAQVATHSTAALSRGYDTSTAGTRVAALATNSLWSTAGITAGDITVTPRMEAGQSTLDEIVTTIQAETPNGLFYFNDSGDPFYRGFNDPQTISATLGEQEVQYDSINLQYDDDLYNQSTASRDGGLAQTVNDATSQGQYGVRSQDATGLIIKNDSDAKLVAQTIVDKYTNPQYRVETVTLNGASQNRRLQILSRDIGDTIRIKRRGEGGTANPDVVCRILGKQKHLDTSRHLTCTWNVSRGFSAATTNWHLGVNGYSELGQTTVLA